MNLRNMSEQEIGDLFLHRIEANRKRFTAQYRIGLREQSAPWGAMATIDRCSGHLVMSIIHDVYCLGEATKTIEFRAEFTVPETWLDAFRDRFKAWIPNWILRRWKYNTKTLSKVESVTVDARALLPDVPVRFGDGPHIQFAVGSRARP